MQKLTAKRPRAFGLEVLFEAFADRCYDDNGALLSRTKEGAVHSREKMLEQVFSCNSMAQ